MLGIMAVLITKCLEYANSRHFVCFLRIVLLKMDKYLLFVSKMDDDMKKCRIFAMYF